MRSYSQKSFLRSGLVSDNEFYTDVLNYVHNIYLSISLSTAVSDTYSIRSFY